MAEPVYEMSWDCGHCDAKGLLGITHRFCPHCGGPQDPTRRYFPADDDKVAVQDHVFVGADRVCPACASPMSAKADFCGNCGSPLDVAKQARLVDSGTSLKARRFQGDAAPLAAKAPSASKRWMVAILLGLLLLAICCGVATTWTQQASAVITGTRWERTIAVERFTPVSESGWNENMPRDAYGSSCHDKQRETRKIPDGEDCRMVKVDQGDGSFKEKRECTPRYREEPVMGSWCTWTADRWRPDRVEKATGTADPRSWPVAHADGCGGRGCTREGERVEHLWIDFTVDSQAMTCDVDEKRWLAASPGEAWDVAIRPLGDVPVCEKLQEVP